MPFVNHRSTFLWTDNMVRMGDFRSITLKFYHSKHNHHSEAFISTIRACYFISPRHLWSSRLAFGFLCQPSNCVW
jgi:hypothetical protein